MSVVTPPATTFQKQEANKPATEKSEGAVNKPMSAPTAPRLLDPQDRTASMPIIRNWQSPATARTVSEIRPASANETIHPQADADGWYPLR